MKTIKHKVLFGFISVAFITSVMIIGVVSWKLDQGFSEQANLLSGDAKAKTDKALVGYNRLLRSSIDALGKRVARSAADISGNPMVGRNIDSQQLDSLAEILKKACKTSEMDFALIYDPEGRLQSSFPQSL